MLYQLEAKKDQNDYHFWQNKLKDISALVLPYDYPRPTIPGHQGTHFTTIIDKKIYSGLKKLSEENSVSLQTIYLAALYLLLTIYGNTDVLIPVSASGRNHRNNNQIGFFSKVAPVRIKSDSCDKNIEGLLAHCNDELINALAHADQPLHEILDKVEFKRDGASNPFGQLLLSVFDEAYTTPPSLDGLKVSYYRFGYDAARMDLIVEVMPKASGELMIGIFSANQRFKADTTRGIASRLSNIIENLTRKNISTDGIVERSSLFGRKTLTNKALVSYFDDLVRDYPNKFVLTKDATKISYLELKKLIDQVAVATSKFSTFGRVLIYLPRGFELIASYYALIREKITFIPVDINVPSSWVEQIIKIAAPSAVITTTCLRKKIDFAQLGLDILEVDNLNSNHGRMASFKTNDKNEVAYILFTSGSTGKPKGVCISYQNVTNLVGWAIGHYSKRELQRVLFSTSVSFDLSIFEIFVTISSGGSLIIVDNALSLLEMKAATPSLLNLTPSICRTLLKHNAIPQSVSTINLAGEAIDSELVGRLYESGHIKKVYNLYAPTETTTYSTCKLLSAGKKITVGCPIDNTVIHVIDDDMKVMCAGKEGQIAIAGSGVSVGYVSCKTGKQPFIENTLSPSYSKKMYLTGDYGYVTKQKELKIIGRHDQQIKIRGHRVEVEQIRQCVLLDTQVENAVVTAQKNSDLSDPTLAVFLVLKNKGIDANKFLISLKREIESQLPIYMVPTHYKVLDEIPMLINGKVDYQTLKAVKASPLIQESSRECRPSTSDVIAKAWSKILGHSQFSSVDNFFDVGGNSLLAAELYSLLRDELDTEFRLLDLFVYPTIEIFQNFLGQPPLKHTVKQKHSTTNLAYEHDDIAVIGVSLRLPKASSLDEYWDILEKGEVVLKPTEKQMLSAFGVDLHKVNDPDFVPVSGIIDKPYDFDNIFFNFTNSEAQDTDPQQRLFLEVAWEALQDAGTIPGKTNSKIGVFAGCGACLYSKREPDTFDNPMAEMQWQLGNEKDYLATKVAYKLNLNGPAVNINTACSTGLSALATGCQYLQSGLVDVALAGAVTLILPESTGYMYNSSYIYSKSGVCSPFDQSASGTVPSSGVVVIVLKRLKQSLADGDTILGVIKGYAVNNDGNKKPGFTAPSALSQASCLKEALVRADVQASQVKYIETHGTGTNIGDPIEVEGIKQAYEGAKECVLGSAKANIGHTDTVSGLAGLLKVLAMFKYGEIVPQPNFRKLNSQISLGDGAFYINTELRPWPELKEPIYAGISSFGIGGTNVHLIVKNHPPEQIDSDQNLLSEPAVFLLSAKSEDALERIKQDLIEMLHSYRPDERVLHRIAYTFIHHRFDYQYRYAFVAHTIDEALHALSKGKAESTFIRYKNKYLIEQWLSGNHIDMNKIYTKGVCPPVHLPYHPLNKKMFTIPLVSKRNQESNPSEKANLNDSHQATLNQVLEIFKDLLGAQDIKPTDSFFSLGGDSLLLLRLIASLKKTCNVDLEFDEVFDNDSAEQIALLTHNKVVHKEYISLECMHRADEQTPATPIVFLHPGNGALFQYQAVIKAIEYEGAIYGIKNTMSAPLAAGMGNIERYAKDYLELIAPSVRIVVTPKIRAL